MTVMNEYAEAKRGGPWTTCPHELKAVAECPELEDAWDPYVDVAVNALSLIFYDNTVQLDLRFEAALYMEFLVSDEEQATRAITSDKRLASLLADQLQRQLQKYCGIRNRPFMEELLSTLLLDVERNRPSDVVYAIGASSGVASVDAKDDSDESATGQSFGETNACEGE